MAKGAKTGGRAKGTPNKLNADIKGMIQGALHQAGGQAYLLEQARENPVAFLTLLGKTIPKDVNATLDGDVNLKLEVVFGRED